jgi:hypothetical protein
MEEKHLRELLGVALHFFFGSSSMNPGLDGAAASVSVADRLTALQREGCA